MNDVISYLLSLRKASGEPVVRNHTFQIVIPNFPSLMVVEYNIVPQNYAQLMYGFQLSPEMVPHSFDLKVFDPGGSKAVDVITSGLFAQDMVESFLIVTKDQQLKVKNTNLTMLSQYYDLTVFYLSMADSTEYDLILEALGRIHNPNKLEKLAARTNEILVSMGTGTGQPLRRPPIIGE